MVEILVTKTSLQYVSDLIVHLQGVVFCAQLKLYILLHTKLVPVSVWQLPNNYHCVHGCMFCILLFNSVIYVFLLLRMFRSVYSVFIVPAGTLRLP
jgi:hypothetical protein